jgi:hypothetical protein
VKLLVSEANDNCFQPRKNVPFEDEGVSKLNLDNLSQYLLPVGNAHIGKYLDSLLKL